MISKCTYNIPELVVLCLFIFRHKNERLNYIETQKLSSMIESKVVTNPLINYSLLLKKMLLLLSVTS